MSYTITSECIFIDLLLVLSSQSNPAHGWLDEEQAFHSCEKYARNALDGGKFKLPFCKAKIINALTLYFPIGV